MKVGVTTRINLALGLGALLLTVIGIASHLSIRGFLDSAGIENESEQAILLLERAMAKLRDAESQQRKYLITESPEDLQAYRAARAQVAPAMQQAMQMDPSVGERRLMGQLDAAIERRLVRLDDTLATRQSFGLEAASLRVTSDESRELRGSIDALAERVRAGEAAALQAMRANTRRSGQILAWLIPAGGALSLLLLLWAMYLVNLHERKRLRAETRLRHNAAELQRAGEALRVSETRLRQIMDAVPALIAYADAEQRLQFHNVAFEEGVGLSTEQVRGRTLREVAGEAAWQRVGPRVQEAYDGYVVSYAETHRNLRGEPRDYEITLLPRYGEGRQRAEVVGIYVLGSDITEFKRIDRLKSEFVSTVSHELRTPLTSIRGSLGLVAAGAAGPVPPKAAALLNIAKDNCERLVRLINDILDSEKIESGQVRLDLQPTPLAPLLRQAMRDNEGFAAQHQVSLLLEAADEAIVARVDSDRFIQVVTNLLSNAVKFSPSGASVQLRLVATPGFARVEVRDHGPGIPAEFRPHMFHRFSQADASDARQKGGTGLGLSISRALVERMAGRIDFRSEPQGGTTFFFELPCLPPKEAAEGSVAATAAPPSHERLRILVCEDDADVARLIVQMLDTGGFDADVASSAEEALRRLAAGRYHAMTVDIKLPGRDGVWLIRKVRQDEGTRGMPVVVVSAAVDQGQLRFDEQPLMVSGWLTKPIDQDALVVGLRRAIAGVKGDKPRILHVEDDRDIQRITAAIAHDVAHFVFAATPEEAREKLRSEEVDAVLLDVDLGEGREPGSSLFADIGRLDPAPPVVIYSAKDISAEDRAHATAILLKSQASNEELREALSRAVTRPSPLG